jgi:hypothetical protein
MQQALSRNPLQRIQIGSAPNPPHSCQPSQTTHSPRQPLSPPASQLASHACQYKVRNNCSKQSHHGECACRQRPRSWSHPDSSTETPCATSNTPCRHSVCQGRHSTAQHDTAQHTQVCACHQGRRMQPPVQPTSQPATSQQTPCVVLQDCNRISPTSKSACCTRALAHAAPRNAATTVHLALFEKPPGGDTRRMAGLDSPQVYPERNQGGGRVGCSKIKGDEDGLLAADTRGLAGACRMRQHATAMHRLCRRALLHVRQQ